MNSIALRVLAGLLAAIGLFVGGTRAGYVIADNKCKAEQADAKALSVEMHNAAAIAGKRSEQVTVRRVTATEAVFNGIQQGVILYAQSHASTDCRLDDDGLRLWAAANAGADVATAASADAVVSAADVSGERGADRPADQSHSDGTGLSPVPGPASGIGRLVNLNGGRQP